MPAAVSSSVVLPAPFGPIRPSTSFARTSKETSVKARCSPYRLLKPAIRITADAGCVCGEFATLGEAAIHTRPLCDLIVIIVVVIITRAEATGLRIHGHRAGLAVAGSA